MNITDTSSYLDLSPLYGHTQEIQNSIRTFKDGLLKPDTFAEERLLRQPPGVNIMLVMYNRYHNFVAREIKKINEGGRFSLPAYARSNYPPTLEAKKKREDLASQITKLEEAVAKDHSTQNVDALVSLRKQLEDHDAEMKPAEEKAAQARAKLDYDLFNTARL